MLTQELQDAMQEGAMIARTEEGLTKCLRRVLELQERAKNLHVEGSRIYNPGWHTARDIQNMLNVSEIIVRCALERKESRGAQWRPDYPDPDPEWGKKMLIATKGDNGEVKISTTPVPGDAAGACRSIRRRCHTLGRSYAGWYRVTTML